MALDCIRCGKTLPRDDARFCPNCGARVSSRPLRAQPSTPQEPVTPRSPARSQPEHKKPLREQVAEQPPARSLRSEQGGTAAKKTIEIVEGEAQAPRGDMAARALRVKVWGPEAPAVEAAEKTAIEDLPTRELTVAPAQQSAPEKRSAEKPPGVPEAGADSRQLQSGSSLEAAPTAGGSQTDDVAQRDTLLLSAQGKPATPAWQPLPRTPFPSFQRMALALSSSGRRRPPWLIVVGLLCILVLGGVSAWIVRDQPFSVPAVTQPQQSFRDTQLGLSLLYPSGWTVQVERGNSTVRFFDSSHTAEVDITIAPASSGDLAQYLQRQAAQRGMTGVKMGAQLSFAGASWQQIQGNVLESGADYIETIFATIHSRHLVTLTQIAHQSIYAAEEKMSFAPLRSSLRLAG